MQPLVQVMHLHTKPKIIEMKARNILLALCLPFLLGSCLEITEQVHLNKDNSGQFTFSIDLHESEPFIKFMSGLGSQDDLEEEFDMDMDKALDRLKNVKGINNVLLIQSDDELLQGITFSFRDISALNRGINAIHDDEKDETYFSLRGNTLHRFNTLDSEVEDEIDDQDLDLDITLNGKSFKGMLKSMAYHTEIILDTPVKRVSNSDAKISSDGKKVSLTHYFLDEQRGARSLENSIEL